MTRFDRDALDRHITGNYGEDQFPDEDFEEYEPPCPHCGKPFYDHIAVQKVDELGNDYETYDCPPKICVVCRAPLAEGKAHDHTLSEVIQAAEERNWLRSGMVMMGKITEDGFVITSVNTDLPDILSGDNTNG